VMSSTLISTSNGSPDCGDHLPSFTEPSSIHSALINEIYDVPMREISRPLLSVLNEDKVQSLIQTIRVNIDEIPPIDILWYEAPNSGNNYFFAMGGCHRWEYVSSKKQKQIIVHSFS